MLITFCTISVVAQQGKREVSGTVTDSTNAPLDMVIIMEKGARKGITTNAKGEFKFNIRENATLIFS